MLVRLTEVLTGLRGGPASLSEIYVNSSHIVSVAEDVRAMETLISETKRLGLVENTRFSKIVVTEGSRSRTLTVVGSPHEVYGKIKRKQILRG